MTPLDRNSLEQRSNLLVLLISAFLSSALNGWLLSVCATFLFPSFYLTFWQWWLMAFTIRSLFGSYSSNS